jgi:hypothetical protein
MWRSNGLASDSASKSVRRHQKHTKCFKKAFGDYALATGNPTNGLSVSIIDGYQLTKSVLDVLLPEPRLQMW